MNNRMNYIFCFGDSITYGESDLQSGGWVERLKQYYLNQEAQQEYQTTFVYNLGIASETTDSLKNRFRTELSTRLVRKHSKTIIISYGLNDIVLIDKKGKFINRVPIEYFINNIKECVGQIDRNNTEVILLGLYGLPIKESETGESGSVNTHGDLRQNEDIINYNQALEGLAKEQSLIFIDINTIFRSSLSDLLSSDRLHPNQLGHEKIFQAVKKHLTTTNQQYK